MRVGLFITCFNDTLFPQVGRATVSVLERLGVTVDFPAAQTCCGQMHFNSGYRPECVPLVRNFARVFAGYDAVVTPSASCAAMVRHYHHVVDPAVTVPKVFELCEYLVDVLGVTDVGAYFPHTVAFHATCHSQRLLHIGDFGGTFSVKNPDTSIAMGEDKVADVRGTGAEVLTSADTSCLMHLGGLLSRQGAPLRVLHLAEILAATKQAATK